MTFSRQRLWSKLGLSLATLLLTCGVLEVGARVRARLLSQPHSAAVLEREWHAIATTMLSPTQGFVGNVEDDKGMLTVLHPYIGWDWTGMREALARELEYFKGEDSEGAFDVVLVGGSVAAALGNQSGPGLVQRLASDPRLGGREVRLLNHARAAFKQPQTALWVDYLLILGYEPDLVLMVDGFNELALSMDNAKRKAHPHHPAISQWAHLTTGTVTNRETLDAALRLRKIQVESEGWLQRAQKLGLSHSAVAGPLITRVLENARARYVLAREEFVRLSIADASGAYSLSGPPSSAELGQVVDLGVQAWREGARSIAASCRARSILSLHVLQPALHDEGSKPLTHEEQNASQIDPDWIDAVRTGYPRLRAAGTELAAEGCAFFDASRLFEQVESPLYTDACHLTSAGYQRFADAIADAIAELLVGLPEQAPSARRASTPGER